MENMNSSANDIVAPFILKTYHMVNNPSSNSLITWGSADNTFVVLDPLEFSHALLPVYFKHNNFSSFVRQLNTYGFRKVDPDRWEFANEWFLRGQYHLLRNIARRKQSTVNNSSRVMIEMGDEELLGEIARLRKEQGDLKEELEGMNKRLLTTEKRPHQMMAFLNKVVEDPEILPRMRMIREDKKRRLMNFAPSSSSPSPSTTTASDEDANRRDFGAGFSSPEVSGTAEATAAAIDLSVRSSGGEIKYWTEMESHPPPPYPFSLFGCGF